MKLKSLLIGVMLTLVSDLTPADAQDVVFLVDNSGSTAQVDGAGNEMRKVLHIFQDHFITLYTWNDELRVEQYGFAGQLSASTPISANGTNLAASMEQYRARHPHQCAFIVILVHGGNGSAARQQQLRTIISKLTATERVAVMVYPYANPTQEIRYRNELAFYAEMFDTPPHNYSADYMNIENASILAQEADRWSGCTQQLS